MHHTLAKRFFALSLVLALFLNACAPAVSQSPTPTPASASADLTGIKAYLLGKVNDLITSSAALQTASDQYYTLAQSVNFDYAALWSTASAETAAALQSARAAWMTASPLYEQVEGIVAGVPSLSEFDVILDAGSSAAEDPDNAVPFDITLPDGRVLPQPGNLFGVLETTLWGTNPEYTIATVEADLNHNGTLDFGDGLPDANVFKGAAGLFGEYVAELEIAAQVWQPTESDAFTALVVMTPTMSEYFASWKNSRFVAGAQTGQREFGVISRLADIQDILASLEVVYAGVQPLVGIVNSDQAAQLAQDFSALKAYISEIHQQELAGKQFTAEEADLLGAEAQNRATAIAGQVSQAAATLGIAINE